MNSNPLTSMFAYFGFILKLRPLAVVLKRYKELG